MLRFVLCLLILGNVCHARLGDTRDQAEARYGLPTKPMPAGIERVLLEGAIQSTFEFQGWRIRCAFLRATDGKEYVVREEYTKIWNSTVMKAGGKPSIADFECAAVLEGEAGADGWTEKRAGDLGKDLTTTLTNQFVHVSGLSGKIWLRKDGARACLTLGSSSMLLELPQAVKYEAELLAIRDARNRAVVPKF